MITVVSVYIQEPITYCYLNGSCYPILCHTDTKSWACISERVHLSRCIPCFAGNNICIHAHSYPRFSWEGKSVRKSHRVGTLSISGIEVNWIRKFRIQFQQRADGMSKLQHLLITLSVCNIWYVDIYLRFQFLIVLIILSLLHCRVVQLSMLFLPVVFLSFPLFYSVALSSFYKMKYNTVQWVAVMVVKGTKFIK